MLTTEHASTLTTAISTEIGKNLPFILALVGFGVGVRFAFGALKKFTKVKA